MTACPLPGELVEIEINRLATQYREAEKFKVYLRAVLGQIEEAGRAICVIPTFFDLDTAIGDQLTILGRILGWPRCHCVCDIAPVLGFECEDFPSFIPIAGNCEGGVWIDCHDVGQGEICLDDDEVYRGFLKARRYQVLGLYDIASLQAATVHIWGPTATVVSAGQGTVVLAPGRELTADENRQLPLVFRVAPIAPGIGGSAHLGDGPILGFGAGWGGNCEGASFLCPQDPHTYDCA